MLRLTEIFVASMRVLAYVCVCVCVCLCGEQRQARGRNEEAREGETDSHIYCRVALCCRGQNVYAIVSSHQPDTSEDLPYATHTTYTHKFHNTQLKPQLPPTVSVVNMLKTRIMYKIHRIE